MKTRLLLAAAVAVATALGAAALLLQPAPEPWTGPVDLARGEAVYAENCAACHGAALEGEPDWRTPKPDGRLPAPPHDASGHTWHHPDRVLFAIVREGTEAVVGDGYDSDMPGYADILGDADIRSVLAWIRESWPERERAFQAAVTAQDAALR